MTSAEDLASALEHNPVAEVIASLMIEATAGRRIVWRGVPVWRWLNSSSLSRDLVTHARDHAESFARYGESREPVPITNEILNTAERELLAESLHYPAPELAGQQAPQQRFASLQHHGVATALLDVTFDPLVALHFACAYSADSDGMVYAYDVTDWTTLQTEPGDNDQDRYFEMVDSGEPMLIEPTRPDERMRSQRALFMRCPVNESVGDGQVSIEPAFEPVSIFHPLKPGFVESLRLSLGVRHEGLFPDLAGFAKKRAPELAYRPCQEACFMHPKQSE